MLGSVSWQLRCGAVLALAGVMGLLAVWAAPDGGRAIGIWPVGLAAGALVVARGRRTTVLVAVVLGVAVSTIWVGGRPFEVAVGFGLGIAAETWVVIRLLLPGRPGRPELPEPLDQPELLDDGDLRRYFVAATAGSLVGAGVALTTSLVTGWGDPGLVTLAIGVSHLASQLTLLPLFMRLPAQDSIASTGERLLQWAVLGLATPVLFLAQDLPSLGFLVIPLLAWGALRINAKEAIAQVIAVLGLAILLTSAGRGPFAGVPERYGLPVDVRGILLSAFAVTCVLITIPLVLRVGEYVSLARSAALERDRVRSIVDGATSVAIIGTDESSRITLFNPGAELLLGYHADEVLGRSSQMFHTRQAITDKAAKLGVQDTFASVGLAIARSTAPASYVRFLRKDGVERTHAMSLSVLEDERGRRTGFVSTSEDVTERLAAQRAMEDALEVERRAVERLREVDAVKDSFVSTVSHELRTPITSILGYLELLQDGSYGAMGERPLDALARVSANSHRLLTLIDDLLTLSRVTEAGVRRGEAVEFDLREAVVAAYDVVAPAWDAPRALDVTRELAPEPVLLHGDRDLVERMVLNLVANAVKFTPDGGAVRVVVSVEGGDAVVVVSDTGIGIPEDEQQHLFTRFFRSSLAQGRAIPGSGLGLAISGSIAQQHGGTITATSSVTTGTRMEVRMPIGRGISNFQLPLESVT